MRIFRVGLLFVLLFGTLSYSLSYENIEKDSLESTYYASFFNEDIHTVDIKIKESEWNTLIDDPLAEKYHPCDIVIDGQVLKNVGIRTKGNTSLELVSESGVSDRYSFKINFGKYVKEQTFNGLDELSLNNVFADATYLKEYLAYDMFRYMGVISPLCTFVDITVNGEPWGFYVAVEAVDEAFLIRNFGENYGDLYKPENELLRYEAQNGIPEGTDIVVMGEDLVYVGNDLNSYYTIFDTAKTDIDNSDKLRLIDSIKKLNNSQNLSNVVDIENTLKYWAVNNLISNYDCYIGPDIHNYYLYEQSGKLIMIPWDYNLSFGSYEHYLEDFSSTAKINETTRTINLPILSPIKYSLEGSRPFFEKVVAYNQDEYINYINILIEEYFDSGYFEYKYNDITNKILPHIKKDATAFYNLDEVVKAQELLKEFIDLRVDSVKGQLKGDIIYGDFSTYIDGSHINIQDMGHQRGGYFHIKE